MTIVKSIDQIRLASPLSISNKIEHWQPFLDDSEDVFIKSLFSETMWYFLQLFTSPDTDPVEWIEVLNGDKILVGNNRFIAFYQELARRLSKPEALYAIWLGIDEMAVNITSAGVQVLQSDTNKPAPQYLVMNVKETCLTRAHRNIDTILQWVAQYSQNFTAMNSGYGTILSTSCLISGADQFQTYADIHSSRRVFLSLLPVIRSIEQKYIIPTISQSVYNQIIGFISTNRVDPTYTKLLQVILPAIVHLSMARALLEISIDILDWGIFNTSVNTFNNLQYKAQVNDQRIAVMQEANQRDGEAELKAVQEFMDNNATAVLFAEYFNSLSYAGPASAVKRDEYVNDVTKSIFVV